MSPRSAGVLLTAILATIVAPAAGRPITITCRDGGHGVLKAFGRHMKVDYCDLDRSCDGICTAFVPTPHDVRCLVLGGPDCSGGGGPLFALRSQVVPGCSASVGIPLTERKPRRILFNGRVVVRCLPPGTCPPTTTTTLPTGVPDLTGDWIMSELDASDDCAVPPAFDFATRHRLSFFQLGTNLGAQGDAIPSFGTEGTVSADGFTLDTGDCCSIRNYNFAERVSGTLPSATGVVWLTEEWTFSSLGPPGGEPVCKRTAHAVMLRVPYPCTGDADCVDVSACGRCVVGNCVLAPVFRVQIRPASG